MNGLVSSKTQLHAYANLASLFVCVLAIAFCGCKQDSPSANLTLETGSEMAPTFESLGPSGVAAPQIVPTNGPDGRALLEKLQAKYDSLRSYQDNAVLYLNYRLRGQFMQEPQPWSVAWDSNRLVSKVFNAQIIGDGELLSCYVFDIDSGNLDNQHLLIPYESQLPVSQLYRDPIAKHFIGGFSELPLDETDLVSLPKLIPPQLSLLTKQARNPWLQNPTKTQRLADAVLSRGSSNAEESSEQPCYVVRCLAKGMTADVWIDKEDFSLVQMSLPLKLLAGEVITSTEVTNVELMARFHNPRFNQAIQDDKFGIIERSQSTPVRKFVSLPESFPSELIGELAPDFMLTMPSGKSRTRIFFDGKVTAFLWLAGQPSFSALSKLDEIASKFNSEKFHIGAVYSDSELKTPGTSNFEPQNELSKIIEQVKLPVYYDRQLEASSRLKVNAIPSVIVLDGDSKIQFSRALSDKTWPEDLTAVLNRVAEGDDVASEMLTEYQRFLESYHQQLLTVSAADLIDRPATATTAVGSTNHANRGAIRLRPQESWTNTSFKKAGNAIALSNFTTDSNSASEYVIFDGWRTVVELNATGDIVNRKELELPEGEATSLIRVGTANGKVTQFALFSALGKKVFLFDRAWNPIGSYPKGPSDEIDRSGIRDCRLADLNSNGTCELVVAFNDEQGVHLVDTVTFEAQPISKAASSAIAVLQNDVVVAAAGKIGRLKTGMTSAEETELSFKRVASVGDVQLCGLGVTREGNWTSVGLDQTLKRVWALSVGPQFYECEVEPIAVTQTNSGDVIWAIADDEDVIHLVSGSGKWLGDFQSESQITGIALSASNDNVNLIVANSSGVESWELNIQTSPMRPASMQSSVREK